MQYCKNCNNLIDPNTETDHGLCLLCYQEYLYDKIDHLGEKQPQPESWVKKFFKNFFKNNKSSL